MIDAGDLPVRPLAVGVSGWDETGLVQDRLPDHEDRRLDAQCRPINNLPLPSGRRKGGGT
ncbi:MAG: hypothetical protein ABSG86_14950 [Thermoguttaceae bacterium]